MNDAKVAKAAKGARCGSMTLRLAPLAPLACLALYPKSDFANRMSPKLALTRTRPVR